ncbi:MAG: lysostaphin resistance A-like protein [Beutenbergiaceae bacterium]
MDTSAATGPTPDRAQRSSRDVTPTAVPWSAVAVFAVLACGLAWLVQLPIWLTGDGLGSPLFLPLTAAMMFTPTAASGLVMRFMLRPAHPSRYLGLTGASVKRTIVIGALATAGWLFLGFAAMVAADVVGVISIDWSSPSLALPTDQLPEGLTDQVLILVTFVALPVNVVATSIPAFGEELGWRGFLTTALAPLGFAKAALLSGILWGIWHAPVILLGYNFARPGIDGLLLMCGFTICVGVLLQWARYYTRGVWAAAIGHGALNASAALPLIWLPQGSDAAFSSILGIPGWIAIAVLVAIMVAAGLFSYRLPQPLVVAPTPTSPPTLGAASHPFAARPNTSEPNSQ